MFIPGASLPKPVRLPSRARTVGSPPSGTSALAVAASGMSSGQWQQYAPAGGGLGLFVGGPTSGIRTGYASSMAYDPIGKQIHFIGCDHNQTSKHIVFDEASDAWSLLQDPMPWGQPSDGSGTTAHGYNHSVWDTTNGKLWHRPYGGTDWRRKDGATTWGTVGYGGGGPLFNASAALGAAFHPNLGPNGSLVICQLENGADGACMTTDPVTLAHTVRSSTLTGVGDYHNFALYGPGVDLVWMGSGNGSAKNWTINASGTVAAKDDIPAPIGMIGPSLNPSLPVYNPSTGKFTVFKSSTVWYDFDPTAGRGSQWASRGGTVDLFASNVYLGTDPTYGTVAVALPAYGVVVFVKAWSSSQNAQMWLWKP